MFVEKTSQLIPEQNISKRMTRCACGSTNNLAEWEGIRVLKEKMVVFY